MDDQALQCDGRQFQARDLDNPEVQALLQMARDSGQPVICTCQAPGIPMVIRLHGQKLLIARWPDTGNQHHPDCPSFDLASNTEAVREIEDGTIEVRATFSLTHAGFPRREAKATHTPTVPTSPGSHRALDLTGVLHELWRLSGLDKWFPKMQGKRHWGLVRHLLGQAALPIRIGGQPLHERIFLPEPFRADDAGHSDRQAKELRGLIGTHGLAVLIAPLSGIDPSRYGHRMAFTHMRSHRIYAANDFGMLAMLRQLRDGDRLIGIALIDARADYFRVLDAGAMTITGCWLPYEGPSNAHLLDAVVTGQHRFITRYGRFREGTEVAITIEGGRPVSRVIPDSSHGAGWRMDRF